MEPTPIPLAFVRDQLDLTWPDVAWGYQKGWLDAASVVDYAVGQVGEDEDVSPVVVQLAGLSESELGEVPILLQKTVDSADPGAHPDSERKWLYLVLAWFYKRRDELSDPLGYVEQLYADFGYPEEVRGFVRYMPPESHYEPQAHTNSENIDRLFRKWKEFLDSFAVPQESGTSL